MTNKVWLSHLPSDAKSKTQAQLTDGVEGSAVRQQAKRVVEDATAMEDGGRESQQTGEEVLQFAKLGAFWIRQLGVEVVLAKWKYWNQARPVELECVPVLVSTHYCLRWIPLPVVLRPWSTFENCQMTTTWCSSMSPADDM